MNSIFALLATCLVAASLASAQYAPQQQQQQYQQRKLAPQAYAAAQQQAYGPPASAAYRPAPKAAYTPVATYSKPAPVAAYSAAPAYAAPAPVYHAPNPFAWGYDINDGYGGAQYHKETGDEYGKRTGSYGYTDAYGIYRQVDYVADEHGFRAVIKSNEPGVDDKPSSPADVELHHYEPPTNHYASAAAAGPQEYNAAPAPVAAYAAPKAYAPAAYAKPAAYGPPAAPAYRAQPRAAYKSYPTAPKY